MLSQVQTSQGPTWIGQDHRVQSHLSCYLKSSTTMMLLVFSVVIITIVSYILCVSFNEAATLLHRKNGVMSPLSSIPMSKRMAVTLHSSHWSPSCSSHGKSLCRSETT